MQPNRRPASSTLCSYVVDCEGFMNHDWSDDYSYHSPCALRVSSKDLAVRAAGPAQTL